MAKVAKKLKKLESEQKPELIRKADTDKPDEQLEVDTTTAEALEERQKSAEKVNKMWSLLQSTAPQGNSTKEPSLLSVEKTRPSLLTADTNDLKSTLSMREASSIGESVGSAKAKTPKKPKMSEYDKRAMAKMQKMRADAEKAAEKLQKEKSMANEEKLAADKEVTMLVTEGTLSKIKEEAEVDKLPKNKSTSKKKSGNKDKDGSY